MRADHEGFGIPGIKIVCCNGAGSKVIHRLNETGTIQAELIALEPGKLHLDVIRPDEKAFARKRLAYRFGRHEPACGRRAAELAGPLLKEALANADLVIVIADTRDSKSTEGAGIIAKAARELGALVIAIATIPFKNSGSRSVLSEEGFAELQTWANTLLILDHNRLPEFWLRQPIEQGYSPMDQLISETLFYLVETLTKPALISLSFEDLRDIFAKGGMAGMLLGEAESENTSGRLLKAVLDHPLSGMEPTMASNVLIQISGGPELELKKADEIAEAIVYSLDAKAHVYWTANRSEGFRGKIRTRVILTGVKNAQGQPQDSGAK